MRQPDTSEIGKQDKPVDFFDKGKFESTLSEIVESYRSQHKNLEVVALNQPFELEGEKVVFHLISDIQTEIFQKIKPDLTTQVRRKLNNYNIQLDFEMKEEVEDDKKRLYTSTDKLLYLKEKNGMLGELLTRFQLETDF